jgi:thermostable 8-oxoguanine DNA glycosylase
VSRDFLNNIGMTDSLIPLDVHILREMGENWGWAVPVQTPTDRRLYEQIEDSVRDIAIRVGCTVVEIDKAIFSAQLSSVARRPIHQSCQRADGHFG